MTYYGKKIFYSDCEKHLSFEAEVREFAKILKQIEKFKPIVHEQNFEKELFFKL